jgi:hypothetical protein
LGRALPARVPAPEGLPTHGINSFSEKQQFKKNRILTGGSVLPNNEQNKNKRDGRWGRPKQGRARA